jgi:hypothetical protein
MAVVGALEGLAYREPTSPTGPAQPYASLPILLVPYSPDLESRLASIQSRHRDSARTYTGAHQEIAAAIQGYRTAVVETGAADLVNETTSDAAGRFGMVVPAGRWLLLGWRETAHPRPAKPIGKRAARGFVDNPERAGYALLTYWKVQVDIEGARTTGARLHDRNVWMTTIREELKTPAPPPATLRPPGK